MTDDNKKTIQAAAIVITETVALVILMRVLNNPDTLRMWRAKALLQVENLCQGNAQGWAHAADFSRTMYDRSRMVV